jgi:8-oxo-dGTP pyrophosphatase MutT (NUDIX family)
MSSPDPKQANKYFIPSEEGPVRAAGFVPYKSNKKNKIFVLLGVKQDGYIDVLGGKVEKIDTSIKDTCNREFYEEAEFAIKNPSYKKADMVYLPNCKYCSILIPFKLNSKHIRYNVNNYEIVKIKWFNLKTLYDRPNLSVVLKSMEPFIKSWKLKEHC